MHRADDQPYEVGGVITIEDVRSKCTPLRDLRIVDVQSEKENTGTHEPIGVRLNRMHLAELMALCVKLDHLLVRKFAYDAKLHTVPQCQGATDTAVIEMATTSDGACVLRVFCPVRRRHSSCPCATLSNRGNRCSSLRATRRKRTIQRRNTCNTLPLPAPAPRGGHGVHCRRDEDHRVPSARP